MLDITDDRRTQLVTSIDFNVHPRRLASARASAKSGSVALREHLRLGSDEPQATIELVREPTVLAGSRPKGEGADELGRPGLGARTQVQASPFVEDVVTRLPYVKTCRVVGPVSKNSYFMTDQERLVQLSVRLALPLYVSCVARVLTCWWRVGVRGQYAGHV